MEMEIMGMMQTAQHYSLMSLMYGHQYHQQQDLQTPGFHDMGLLQQQVLVSHIEDFCDCV